MAASERRTKKERMDKFMIEYDEEKYKLEELIFHCALHVYHTFHACSMGRREGSEMGGKGLM
jgi:hypothetical protein